MIRFWMRRAVAASALVLAAGVNVGYAQEAVRIGTSSSGTPYYAVTVAAGELIQKYAGINTTVEAVGGSAANVFGIATRKIELALTNSLAAVSAYNGTDEFKGKPMNLRLVVQGTQATRSLIVRNNIREPKDLIGKTVIGKRRALPELEILTRAYLKVLGVPIEKVNIVGTTNTGEVEDAIRAGSVDGAFLPLSAGAPQVQRPLQDKIAHFLYLTKDQAEKILDNLPPAFFIDSYKPGTFPHQDQLVYFFAMPSYFIAQPELGEEAVYRVTKAILEHNPEFEQYNKLGRDWTLENSLRDFGIPYHPGAVRYFKERGVWTPKMEARQEKLIASFKK